ncbi:hypothetical protein WG899_20815, partial [Paucibacter sp. AS339]|uniref:hypothetical protein n=1 Tax=Paucibacter hankyongi TaxID=3133434 RepID=UPI0030B3DBC4
MTLAVRLLRAQSGPLLGQSLVTLVVQAGCREFAPAGDLLSWPSKKEGKEAAPAAWPCGFAAVLEF